MTFSDQEMCKRLDTGGRQAAKFEGRRNHREQAQIVISFAFVPRVTISKYGHLQATMANVFAVACYMPCNSKASSSATKRICYKIPLYVATLANNSIPQLATLVARMKECVRVRV